jgi:hypothetical protein
MRLLCELQAHQFQKSSLARGILAGDNIKATCKLERIDFENAFIIARAELFDLHVFRLLNHNPSQLLCPHSILIIKQAL